MLVNVAAPVLLLNNDREEDPEAEGDREALLLSRDESVEERLGPIERDTEGEGVVVRESKGVLEVLVLTDAAFDVVASEDVETDTWGERVEVDDIVAERELEGERESALVTVVIAVLVP